VSGSPSIFGHAPVRVGRLPSFQLIHVSGEDLGVHRFSVPDWKGGDTIALGGGTLRVIDIVWHEEGDEVEGTLTVEVVQYG
jgi:hypothetical protein